MLLIFQLLFTLFSIFAILSVWKKMKDDTLGPKGAIFWIGFWFLSSIAVWWPNSATMLANRLGIGRGTDLVLYISLATIFYLLFKLHVKIEMMSRDITRVVREKALEGCTKYEQYENTKFRSS